ncbi:MAG: FAD-dependent oxidoreductase [Bacillota bacterium]|jgi:succinate dehydrogenase/fumarate reductase flavoprotein subunit
MQKADVIVIGAGGAGLVAAIAARKSGADVLLISKTQLGWGGCTAYAGGGFTLASGSVRPEEHAQRTREIGRNVNQAELVDVLSHEGEASLQELADWGVTIQIGSGIASVGISAPNRVLGGAGFTQELSEIARRCGVRIQEQMVVVRLATENERVVGVECINWQTGSAHYFAATGAVVLATGGGGQVYARTDNPARVTGDGYALALQAGLPLIDMEFVQFYPLGWAEPGFPQWMIGLPIIDYVRLTDSQGDEFLLDAIRAMGLADGREANLYARDRCARLLSERILAGDDVLLHLEEVSDADWQRPGLQELHAFYPQGATPAEYGPIRVAPIQHYFAGGVPIDTWGRTGLAGLFACGEVSGGVDGASRVGGNALTNLATFGLRAGKAAAQAERSEPQLVRHEFALERLRWLATGREEPAELRAAIKQVAERYLGPVRSATGLATAIRELDELQPRIADVGAVTPYQRLLALELPGLWITARAIAQAALVREESRGVHYRRDFPEESAPWQRTVAVAWRDGEMITRL